VDAKKLKVPFFNAEGNFESFHEYELTGVVLHSGTSVNSGHYFMIDIPKDQAPVMHNDSSVYSMSNGNESSISNEGVIYRFRKIK
jgi:uncharacterized UBP type Zn finger protein